MRIKNNTAQTGTWHGQQIDAGAYHVLDDSEILGWSKDAVVLAAVLAAALLVADPDDITDPVTGLATLRGEVPSEVVTQMEKNDKTLQSCFAFGITDASGRAEVRYPIPAAGRFLAYGDAEFEVRHFFDRIVGIHIRDDDRLIAWGVAMAMDPEATAPLDDAVIQSLTAEQMGGVGPFPRYPILGGYEDQELEPGPAIFEGGPPAWGPGMSMSYKYGMTEVGPVGGYAYVDGLFYFVITCQKGERCPEAERGGIGVQISIDGAKKDT